MAITVFSDEIVNASELRKNQKRWLETSYKRPVTVKYGNMTLTIMNRDKIHALYDQKHHMELVLKYYMESTKGINSEVFPWAEYLDDKEREQFNSELLSYVRQSLVTGNWSPIEHLLEDWEATAEIERDQELTKLLLTKGAPEKYVTLEG